MKQWYVVKTKPLREQSACAALARLACEPFLPLMKGPHGLKPLFPTYLFVRTDLGDSRQHRRVRFSRGVSYILGGVDGPVPISEIIVSTLREGMANGSLIEQCVLLKEGDSVLIKKGILRDLIGVVEKQLPAQGRVQVLFKWWATTMRARVKYSFLERAA